ncbi:cytidylate kinase-like family protein [Aeoliella sp. ICT_H6.2]|uniref:Cytidylate kinase-like family protein n=1 Tax=Aeoliella straminimaris TaxID=2954799 RepID=A0A9X2F525_9BACT|nr:cytidylate kinase-like family protein [Aeoliella straminimaris]MCO6042392.1 cytidylate kinase-like family protein [Aeoliella straminimaris]
MTTHANRLGESLDRAYRHWRERGVLETSHKQDSTPPHLTVAISRERGAGGGSVARNLAQRLDWPLYDRELLEHIAEKSGVQEKMLSDLDESRPAWFSEILKSLGTDRPMTAAGYAALLHKLLAGLYMHGNCIVLGRGAAQILPPEHTLRVRLIAPYEHRVDRVAENFPSRQEAIKHVKQVDKDRALFVREYFHRDVNNCHDYDLTIDTARLDVVTCCELIERAMAGRIAELQRQ